LKVIDVGTPRKLVSSSLTAWGVSVNKPFLHLEHPVGVFLTQVRVDCFVDADWMQDEADGQQRKHLIILLVDLLKPTTNQSSHSCMVCTIC